VIKRLWKEIFFSLNFKKRSILTSQKNHFKKEKAMNEKQLRWYNIALMAFVSVWGLGNVVNNYAQQGLTVVVSWLLIMALYFVPYALSVGQLGSTFKESSGGVSSWIKETSTKRLAFYAAWTYWVGHMPDVAQEHQGILV